MLERTIGFEEQSFQFGDSINHLPCKQHATSPLKFMPQPLVMNFSPQIDSFPLYNHFNSSLHSTTWQESSHLFSLKVSIYQSLKLVIAF